MSEYIERERLRESLKAHYHPTDQEYESDRQWAVGYNAGLDRALHSLHYAPSADVAPVVHARWENISDFGGGNCFGYCSNCNTEHKAQNPTALKMRYRYCSWCGARMDGDTQ